VRVLVPGDEPALAPFFAAHPDTTLFFQNNTRRGGLVDGGAIYQATYAAVFEGDAIVALVAHCWNGNVLLEAPRELAAIVATAVRASDRVVSGIVGRRTQVVAARSALGLDGAAAYLDSTEDLFALDLAKLHVPEPLAQGAVAWRLPRAAEVPMLVAWRRDYRTQHLHEPDDAALAAKCREEIERHHAQRHHFVLERDGEVVAYAAYNAETPTCVQIGGVWTPPALRGRGVPRSVLFTETDNHFAKSAYRALGYERIGDYGLVLFANKLTPGVNLSATS
jgi:predicted GNAT family acetyltransferase